MFGFLQKAESTLQDFGELFLPKEASEPILAPGMRGALMEWLEEIWAEAELLAVGIGPRKRAIFDGPPGVGKTTLAHHLSARLGLPMLAVRPERIISKYVGESGKNVGVLFDLAREGIRLHEGDAEATPIVLFLDEFDALAPQRSRAETGAEQSRNEEVNTLLQRLEQHGGFVIAATNFGKDIDQAIWRRFDIHLTLELPGKPERIRILERYLRPFGLPPRSLALLADAFETAAPALMRQFCENLKRQIVVGPKINADMTRDAVIDRLLHSVQPHPDLGKPRLWSLRTADAAVSALPWPLPMQHDLPNEETVSIQSAEMPDVVVKLKRRS